MGSLLAPPCFWTTPHSHDLCLLAEASLRGQWEGVTSEPGSGVPAALPCWPGGTAIPALKGDTLETGAQFSFVPPPRLLDWMFKGGLSPTPPLVDLI